MIRIAFDLDNTLASQGSPKENYRDSLLQEDMIKLVNELYDKGHEIYIFTARHFKHFKYTDETLKKSGLKYTGLVMNKINCDLFVDDRGFRWQQGRSKDLITLIQELQKNEK